LIVVTGLVPVTPLKLALRSPKRDGRGKPGHDKLRETNKKGAAEAAPLLLT
jgi:hypothetical protein